MKKSVYFEYSVTIALLILAGVFHSPAFAYASVLALFSAIVREAMEHKLFTVKDLKVTLPDETRKKIQELDAKVSSIEFNIRQSGFFPTGRQ